MSEYPAKSISLSKRSNVAQKAIHSIRAYHVATIVGALDTSVAIAYLLAINPVNWHSGTLLIKLFMVLIFHKNLNRMGTQAVLFISSITLLVFISTILPTSLGSRTLIGFILHFFLSVLLVHKDEVKAYAASVAWVAGTAAALHTLMCIVRAVPDINGRYLYFSGSHPNLGGEIAAGGAICAAWGLRRKHALILCGIFLADCMFMQARSAMVTIAFLIFVIFVFTSQQKFKFSRSAIIAWVLAIVGLSLFAELAASVAEILLVNDAHRGFGSGFTGRSDLWAYAYALFLDSPYIGYGFGFPQRIGLEPHNIFLAALVQGGLLGLVPLVAVLWQMKNLSRRSLYFLSILMACLPLFMFNNRLYNLNVYPFVFYVIIFCSQMDLNYFRKPGRVASDP